MRLYAALCALLVTGGLGVGLGLPGSFSLGGWITAGVLLAFAFLLRAAWVREARAGA